MNKAKANVATMYVCAFNEADIPIFIALIFLDMVAAGCGEKVSAHVAERALSRSLCVHNSQGELYLQTAMISGSS